MSGCKQNNQALQGPSAQNALKHVPCMWLADLSKLGMQVQSQLSSLLLLLFLSILQTQLCLESLVHQQQPGQVSSHHNHHHFQVIITIFIISSSLLLQALSPSRHLLAASESPVKLAQPCAQHRTFPLIAQSFVDFCHLGRWHWWILECEARSLT